jgi:SHS2 domain-containing protein
MAYRLLDHTADLRIEVTARDIKHLFSNAASAISDLITDSRKIKQSDSLRLTVKGKDLEDLMVNWLREILYLIEAKKFMIRQVTIRKMKEHRIDAAVKGEAFDPQRHPLKHEIKAVTYHQIEVKKEPRRWVARVIFDI